MYRGFEIKEIEGDFEVECGYMWAHSNELFQTIEDVQADIEDYLDDERDAAMERHAEEAMERILCGE